MASRTATGPRLTLGTSLSYDVLEAQLKQNFGTLTRGGTATISGQRCYVLHGSDATVWVAVGTDRPVRLYVAASSVETITFTSWNQAKPPLPPAEVTPVSTVKL
jgi:hypothetical protein